MPKIEIIGGQLTRDGEPIEPIHYGCTWCGSGWARYKPAGTANRFTTTSTGHHILVAYGPVSPCERYHDLLNSLEDRVVGRYDVYPRPDTLYDELRKLEPDYPILAAQLAKEFKVKPPTAPEVKGLFSAGEVSATQAVRQDLTPMGAPLAVITYWLEQHVAGNLGLNGLLKTELSPLERQCPQLFGVEDSHAVLALDPKEDLHPHGVVVSKWQFQPYDDVTRAPALVCIGTLLIPPAVAAVRGLPQAKTIVWSPTYDSAREAV